MSARQGRGLSVGFDDLRFRKLNLLGGFFVLHPLTDAYLKRIACIIAQGGQ